MKSPTVWLIIAVTVVIFGGYFLFRTKAADIKWKIGDAGKHEQRESKEIPPDEPETGDIESGSAQIVPVSKDVIVTLETAGLGFNPGKGHNWTPIPVGTKVKVRNDGRWEFGLGTADGQVEQVIIIAQPVSPP
jgi:hypothetical protein